MNKYIANRRKQFADQLNDNDVREQIWAMMVTEDARNPVPCLESLLNRLDYVNSTGQHKTVLQMLHSGFYGPYNRGMYPRTILQIKADRALQKRLNDAIQTVLDGSDLIKGFTDQGMTSDPNGHRQPQVRIGGNVFNDWGGGPGGHDGAEKWRQEFEEASLKPLPAADKPPLWARIKGLILS